MNTSTPPPKNALPVDAESCDDSLIAAPAHDTPPTKFRDEHIGSRKAWGAYVDLTTVVHRQTVAQVDEFLAQLRRRIEQALRQSP